MKYPISCINISLNRLAMKKATIIHLAGLVIYVLAVLFVINGEKIDLPERLLLVIGAFLSQIVCAAICVIHEIYGN